MLPVALTIAGSDPSGGAGIQADLKTFHQFGVYGEAVITLLTVQNTVRVERVEVMAAELVLAQWQAVLADIPPAAAKTGALGSVEIVEAMAHAARSFAFPLVVDPVMISKHGHRLLTPDAANALRGQLLPVAALLTPNLPEAEELSGIPVTSASSMREAARRIHGAGAAAVLVKGGHLPGLALDILFDGSNFHDFPATRVDTPNTHGTGCTLSAAITACLAAGANLEGAVERSKAFITRAIASSPGLGRGSGPVNHFAAI
jgi:hydroxymethylpyrimidine/phosphomethylpyrimidine kinase